MSVPRAFISHFSRDRDRFVLGFARRLGEAALDAWVDLHVPRFGE